MNKRLPYEEQLAEQLNDVSLPDENMAWADMKRRLEKDDDDRIIPFWLNGCLLWTVVGVVIVGLGWWIVRPEKWFERERPEVQKVSKSQSGEGQQTNLSQKTEPQQQQDSRISFNSRSKQQKGTVQNHTKEITGRNSKEEMSQTSATKKNISKQNDLDKKENRSDQVRYDNNPLSSNHQAPVAKQVDAGSYDSLRLADDIEKVETQKMAVTKANTENQKKDSVSQNTKTKEEMRDSSKSPEFSFAAGLSLHQQ